MFDVRKLISMVSQCTTPLRKGEVLEEKDMGPLKVISINDFPSQEEIGDTENTHKLVDLHFIDVLVHEKRAEQCREDFIYQLNNFPDKHMLAGGPSYIALGGVLGDQTLALQFLAMGDALGLWKAVTPKTIGIEGPMADELAGRGYVMCTGYGDLDLRLG